jgi:lipopolysaccharide/colanic/teichoic acid biosynthesis glycosyltransferase
LHAGRGGLYDDPADPAEEQLMQRALKCLLDRLLALLSLIILSPVFLIAAIGIKCSSRGPIIYRAQRMGKNMQPMVIYKFRSMHVGMENQGAITGRRDPRVFAFGSFLRKTKIDELPQLLNILFGSMSIIGPRPEDIDIVRRYYTDEEKRTLDVLPGLACPGSIFNYTHGDLYLTDEGTDEAYVNRFLHVKLALDLYYIDHWSLGYDISIIFRTLAAIFHTAVSDKQMPPPLEYRAVFGQRPIP